MNQAFTHPKSQGAVLQINNLNITAAKAAQVPFVEIQLEMQKYSCSPYLRKIVLKECGSFAQGELYWTLDRQLLL